MFLYGENEGIKEYSHTNIKITVDSAVDPVIADIFNEIKSNSHVHVGGRYFICKRIESYRQQDSKKFKDDFFISLTATEEFRKGEAVNEIR